MNDSLRHPDYIVSVHLDGVWKWAGSSRPIPADEPLRIHGVPEAVRIFADSGGAGRFVCEGRSYLVERVN